MTQAGILDERYFTRPSNKQNLSTPLLIVGGSTAAYAAALGALQAGVEVCLVQPELVLGGQFTAQALSASDDGRLLTPDDQILPEQRDPQQLRNSEMFALSRSQQQFRDRQRQLQPVADQVIQNPGGSWVSHLSVTPVVAAIALNEAILPFLEKQQLTLIPYADPIDVLFHQDSGPYRRVTGIYFKDRQTQNVFTIHSQITIEATDLGDLLELGDIESRIGQEARAETGEAALPETAYPQCQQAITFCAVVERAPAAPLAPPVGYDQEPWLQSREFTCDFWFQTEHQWQRQRFYDPDGMFRYRRLERSVADEQVRMGDVTVLNWATSPLGKGDAPPDAAAPLGCGNDYRSGCLVGVSPAERQEQIQRARDRTQTYVHFLQTQLQDLKPRGDFTWTDDGIALSPYIREARRGIALTTIRHQDVAKKFFPNTVRARTFADSIGIGQYHYLDMHPNDAPGQVDLGDGHDALPFTIPLGALVPTHTDGLILSSKSIGTTHITNAAYRMHPVEWAIGEAGGHLAAFALQHKLEVREVAIEHGRSLQRQLTQASIPIVWLNDVSHDDPDFTAIQLLAIQLLSSSSRTECFLKPTCLNFEPDAIATLRSFTSVLTQLFAPASETLQTWIDTVTADAQQNLQRSLTHDHLISLMDAITPSLKAEVASLIPQDPVRKRDVARVVDAISSLMCLP